MLKQKAGACFATAWKSFRLLARKFLWSIAFWLMADKPADGQRMAESCTAGIFERAKAEYAVCWSPVV
jgi:hypothetical protein